jgi:hypothetical protein
MDTSIVKMRLLIWITLVASLIIPFVTMAQHGGKAEPLRVEFKRGASSTTINGAVRGSEEAEYVLAAKKGQRLIIKLTSAPVKSSCFDLKGPDQAEMGLDYDCNSDYSKPLSATGDYFISVTRTSQGKGSSRYRMTITVR